MPTQVTKNMVGRNVYTVSYGTQEYIVVETTAYDAIRKICKEMNVGGRYRVTNAKTYTNEAGQEETQARVKGRFVNFTIFAILTPVHA